MKSCSLTTHIPIPQLSLALPMAQTGAGPPNPTLRSWDEAPGPEEGPTGFLSAANTAIPQLIKQPRLHGKPFSKPFFLHFPQFYLATRNMKP